MLTSRDFVTVHSGSIGSRQVAVAELRDAVSYSKQVPIISPPVNMPGIPVADRIDGLISTDDLVGASVSAPGFPNGTRVTRILTRVIDPSPVSQGQLGSVEVSTRSQSPAPADPVDIEFSWPSPPISMQEGVRYLIIRPRWPASLAEKQERAAKEARERDEAERKAKAVEDDAAAKLRAETEIHARSPEDGEAVDPYGEKIVSSASVDPSAPVPVVEATATDGPSPEPSPDVPAGDIERVDEPEVKTLAALTVRLPPNPIDGQIAHIFSSSPIEILTIEPLDGQSLEGEFAGPLEAARAIEFLYSASDRTWDRCR